MNSFLYGKHGNMSCQTYKISAYHSVTLKIFLPTPLLIYTSSLTLLRELMVLLPIWESKFKCHS